MTNQLPSIFWIEKERDGKIYRQTTMLRWSKQGKLEQCWICREDSSNFWEEIGNE